MRNVLLIFLILVLIACGPVNEKKPAANVTGGPNAPLKGVNTSQNNQFLVYTSLFENGEGTKSKTPSEGDNVYSIRVVSFEDLSSLPETAQINVNYWMPDMPAMGKFDSKALRGEDGTYKATLFFGMTGRWQMTIQIESGDRKDTYVFEVTF